MPGPGPAEPSYASRGLYAGKVTIVTGGSRGIGEGIVRTFAREGSHVIFCALPTSTALAHAMIKDVDATHPYPGRVLTFIPGDVTKSSDLEALVHTAMKLHGRIDCVVNNAGWHPPQKSVDETSVDEFRSLLEINLVSAFALSRLAMPHLRATKGSIINIGSMSGYFGQPGSATYCATKSALTGMSKSLAIDEAVHGVRVNTLSPSNIWTPLWEEHVSHLPNKDELIQEGARAQTMARMGTIHEIGEAVLHLARATFTTGIDYLVSGGAELGYGRKAAFEFKDVDDA